MAGVFYPHAVAMLKVVFDGFGGGDSDPLVIHVEPRSASVHLNGYRQADTFDLEFDAKMFPFSPELIRAAQVELFLFQTPGLVADAASYANNDALKILGLVDDAKLLGDGSGATFTVSGRDYTCLMLDKEWPVGRRIPVGDALDLTVQRLVDECTHSVASLRALQRANLALTGVDLPLTANTLEVVYKDESDDVSTHRVAATTTQAVQKIKAKKPTTGQHHSKTNGKGIPVRSGKSYWDVIYSLCLQHGFICFVRGQQVVISKPQVLMGANSPRAFRLAYGRNLASLEIDRHMGREQVPQIVVTSYDPTTKTTLEAAWPLDKDLGKSAKTSPDAKPKGNAAAQLTAIGTVKESIRRYVFPGITDLDQLTEIAKTIYQALGRSESKIRFSTADLKDLDSVDLLKMVPGDGVRLSFDEVKIEQLRELSTEQREARLRALGYQPRVAHLIATEFAKVTLFQQPFYVKDVTLSWSQDKGLDVEGEAINFISVKRDDKQ